MDMMSDDGKLIFKFRVSTEKILIYVEREGQLVNRFSMKASMGQARNLGIWLAGVLRGKSKPTYYKVDQPEATK